MHRQPSSVGSSLDEYGMELEIPRVPSERSLSSKGRRTPGPRTPSPKRLEKHPLVRCLTGQALLNVLLAVYITFTLHYFYSQKTLNPSGCIEVASASELQYVHNQARPVLLHSRKVQAGTVTGWHDPRTTVATCLTHWAKGIDGVAADKLKKMRIFFSLNLRDNDGVTAHLFHELTRVLERLSPHKTFLSVYESGSTDATSLRLETLAATLNGMGIPHSIVANGIEKHSHETRIEFLAKIRNKGLAPLLREIWDGPHGNETGRYFAMQPSSESPLTGIDVWSDDRQVLGIELYTGKKKAGRFGSPGGVMRSLHLEAGEEFVEAEGSGENQVLSLWLTTSHGRKVGGGCATCVREWATHGKRLLAIAGFGGWSFEPQPGVNSISFAWELPRQARRYDRVVYLNDVYFCAEDVVLLLMHDGAHMATAVDTLGVPPEANATRLWMYDWWVARDIDGQTMKVPFPPTKVNQSVKWFEEGKPIPVYCSCNGMVSVDSRVFYDKKLTFRSKSWHGECSASEYTHFCEDVWKVYGADTRIVMDGRVVVAYQEQEWRHVAMARRKAVPPHMSYPQDVGIRPNPWLPLPPVDHTLVYNTLKHIPARIDPPLTTSCVPIHEDSAREAVPRWAYDILTSNPLASPPNDWKWSALSQIRDDWKLPRDGEPSSTLSHNTASGPINAYGYQLSPHASRLYSGNVLRIGEGSRLVSRNMKYMLLFQYDRRVVTYQLGFPLKAVSEWQPDTLSSVHVAMQKDGNLVLTGSNGAPKWSSETAAGSKAYMELSNNGSLEVRVDTNGTSRLLWTKSTIAPLNPSKGPAPMGVGGGIFVSLTLFEGAHINEDLGELLEGLCVNMVGRIFVSVATVGPTKWPPWRSAMSGILIAHLCSHNNTGWFATGEEAVQYHEVNYQTFAADRDGLCSLRINPEARGLYTGDLLYDFVIESLEKKEQACCEDMFRGDVERVSIDCRCRLCPEIQSRDTVARQSGTIKLT